MAFTDHLTSVQIQGPGAVFTVLLLYILYQRFFHPLASYPGPFWASLSNSWKAYYVYHLTIHEQLIEAHRRYGPVVRIGPNDLHFWDAEAIAPIYKAGRSMAKTEFYDAFTAFNPNLFGGRDEDIHSLRRRQLSHGLSQSSIQKMEGIIDEQMQIFIGKLKHFAKTQEVFDLKLEISRYVFDVLGEAAFCRSFRAQQDGAAEELSAINDHLFLAGVMGQLPLQGVTKSLVTWLPVPWLNRLIKSRNRLKVICAQCVQHKMSKQTDRPDLLQKLVNAKDPETGATLTEQEINSEAFAMLVAGSHSTSGTLSLLFWHILHHPQALAKVRLEIDQVLGPVPHHHVAYSIKGLEECLKYTMLCVRENFRMNPVFSMLLWRRVLQQGGVVIGGSRIPYGTNVSISNYVLHHNPQIWGTDHDVFEPGRFIGEKGSEMLRNLIPFSVGHRACIGRNLAMTNILKTTTTILKLFDIEPLEKNPNVRLRSSGIGEMEGPFLCKAVLRN